MKKILILCLLLFSLSISAQFYDDFSDGNYTSNPRWFMTDMEAKMETTTSGYAVEVHPMGEIAESEIKKGSFRTANTLMDNTWWGCDLTFDINKNSEGEIRFYLMSTLPNLSNADGYVLSIDLKKNRLLLARTHDELFQAIPVMTQNNILNYGTINFSCKITKIKSVWTITCYCNENKIWQEELTATPDFNAATSTGFLLFENPNNPYNLRVNSVNCGDKPQETDMIKSNDIVITEIMAKPNPAVKLPEVEWIEIYNTTDRTLTLEGCKIGTPAKTGTLGNYILEAGDYAILCSYNAMTELIAVTDKICVVESMPALNNDGNILTLKNKQNHTISFVEYTIDWYESEPFKADGGWSLERRDPSNPLSNSTTWAPSIDPRGGTPAEENSVACSLPDMLIPRIIGFGIENNKTIEIRFNKPMQNEIIELQQNIHISGNSLKSINWVEPKHEALNLHLTDALDSTNTVEISFYNLTCISGWIIPDTTITLAMPHQARYMDLIFNELMTYVSDGNSKFIELYNNSDFYIDLNGIMLSNRDEEENLKSPKVVCSTSKIIPPHQYVVISPDTNMIKCSLGINAQSIYINTTLPSMPAKEGKLVLSDRSGYVIDEVHYDEKWHHPTLKELHNISLERIDPMAQTQDKNNWHSASSLVGYNTAGWENSQTIENSNSESSKYFWLEEAIFSPNSDGDKDNLIVRYKMPMGSYNVSIDIYTRHGDHIGNVANNLLIGTEGYITWNGTTADGAIVPVGLYVIIIQATNPNGEKINKKFVAIKI